MSGTGGRQARRMGGQESAGEGAPFDTSVPHIARVYDYWLGGKHNFASDRAAAPVTARSHAEVCRFFAGLDLLEPGVVQLHRWRPGTADAGQGRELANYGGVARKP